MSGYTLAELSRLLHARELSSTEIVKSCLDRAERYNGTLNCFISLFPEYALEQARVADSTIAAGEAGPLTGLPVAHKDIFCTEGFKTSCGSKMLDSFIAPYQATAMEKLDAAGTVMIGKTNMDEFAMGSSNETSYYGPVRNPWDISRAPGGSSGGSACAVSARIVPAATATDTGGSIRQPAAFCGVTGLKPTYGRVSRYGMIAYASSLDQGGPIARTAQDAAMLLAAMSGFDPKDATSAEVRVDNYLEALNNGIKGLKIGLPKEYFASGLEAAGCRCDHRRAECAGTVRRGDYRYRTPPHRAVYSGLLRDSIGRMLLKSFPVRWRSFWSPLSGPQGYQRPVLPFSRRGFRQ